MASTSYPALATEDLIGVVCRYYPSHIVEMVWDFSTHTLRKDIKDTLALYLVKQVRSSVQSDNPVQNILDLRSDYEQAFQDLQKVINGLTEYLNTWLLLDFCHFLKRQKRKVLDIGMFRSWLSLHDVQVIRDGSAAMGIALLDLFPGLDGDATIPLIDGMVDKAIEHLSARLFRCPEILPEPALPDVISISSEGPGATATAVVTDPNTVPPVPPAAPEHPALVDPASVNAGVGG